MYQSLGLSLGLGLLKSEAKPKLSGMLYFNISEKDAKWPSILTKNAGADGLRITPGSCAPNPVQKASPTSVAFSYNL